MSDNREEKKFMRSITTMLAIIVVIGSLTSCGTKEDKVSNDNVEDTIEMENKTETETQEILSNEEYLTAYLNNTILKEMTLLNTDSYVETHTYDDAHNLTSKGGILSYKILDLDKDNQDELMLLYSTGEKYILEVYEVEERNVVKKAEQELGDAGWCSSFYTDDITIIYSNECNYILYTQSTTGALADGYNGEVSLWKYTGAKIEAVMDIIQTDGGSTDFEYTANHYNESGKTKESTVIYKEYSDDHSLEVNDPDGSVLASQFTSYGITIQPNMNMFGDLDKLLASIVSYETLCHQDVWISYYKDESINTNNWCTHITIHYNDTNKVRNQMIEEYRTELVRWFYEMPNYPYGIKYCFYDMNKDGIEELIVNVDDHMYFYIYTIIDGKMVLVETIENGAGARHRFSLTTNGYCFTYYDLLVEDGITIGAQYVDCYFVFNGFEFLDIATCTELSGNAGSVFAYSIYKDGAWIEVDRTTYDTVMSGVFYEEDNWLELTSAQAIQLPSAANETLEQIIANERDYILPTSNIEYLTREDIAGLSAEELRLARNELYARHGRLFDDETLSAYFTSRRWYNGTVKPDDFTETVFNEYEIANRDLIVEYEKELGLR